MKLDQRIGDANPAISFEFFPPKTESGYTSLYRTIADLKQLNPSYVSVTWGAGGSTRRKTAELTIQIQRDLNLTAMSHMTCVFTVSFNELFDCKDSVVSYISR